MRRAWAGRALLVSLLVPVFLGPTGSLAGSRTIEPPPAPERVPGALPPLEEPFLVDHGVVRRTLAYGPAGLQQSLDVYTPARTRLMPRPTVLLIHGGSWLIGDSTEWADEAVELVQSRSWTAVGVNYRLAPEAPWPAQLEDARAALDLLRRRAPELGIDVHRMGAIGDSAGGHLAALLGEPAPGSPALRSIVTWSGVNDLTGLTRQRSSGSLAGKVVRDLMGGCPPEQCPREYAAASPAAAVGPDHAATLAFSSEGEQIDPRQAWVMDAALHRRGVPSRVHVLPGSLHARGYQETAWPASLAFLAATLTPETSLEYPRPDVRVTLDLPPRSTARVGEPVRLRGVVRPRQAGSTVSLQVRRDDGSWRTARVVALRKGRYDTWFDLTWTPLTRGTTVWRAVWRGGGGTGASEPRAVEVR